MTVKSDITAIVMTLNEERNIAACLESIVDLCQAVYVVDSGSTDNTKAIAESFGVTVVNHDFVTHASQFNWALSELPIQTKWVLRLDADERLTKELQEEIWATLDSEISEDIHGFVLRFRTYFMGKFLRHGGVYPFRKLLLFKASEGMMVERAMDEHITLKRGRAIDLKNDGLHFDYKSLDHFIKKHLWYASKEAFEYKSSSATGTLNKKRQIYYRLLPFWRAKFYFIYRYYIRGGFLDGKEGKIFHTMQAFWYRFLVDAILYEQRGKKGIDIKLGKME
jgi:glycosyltransferase involved in cell wall biosynthesis